jgi:hypothetical protein
MQFHQNAMAFITEMEKSTLKFTTSNQGSTQQKEQCWRYHNTRLQTILQSNSNKNSMVLAQKKQT